jgi:hypothetical protein
VSKKQAVFDPKLDIGSNFSALFIKKLEIFEPLKGRGESESCLGKRPKTTFPRQKGEIRWNGECFLQSI